MAREEAEMRRFPILLALPLLGGCVSTAAHIVTAPVRATAWGVDKMTTSQSESDRNLGRKVRKQRERDRKEARKAQRRAEAAQR